MATSYTLPIVTTAVLLIFAAYLGHSQKTMLSFHPGTPFQAFRKIQKTITQFNCGNKPKARLRMPKEVLAQLPKFNELPGMIYYPNRTRLIHLHNMALNRAFYFSYILQTFNKSNTDFPFLPGLLYIYLSTAADITANPLVVNGSVLMYGVQSFYPNFYTTFGFNNTLNLFAIRAIRIDNTFQTANFIREPNLQTIRMYDLGAQGGENYTWSTYRNAPWYGKGVNTPNFLPDSNDRNTIGVKTHRYILDFQWTATEKAGSSFFGPPYPGQLETASLPVRFTENWFDCGKQTRAFNNWVASTVAPVADYMPRYAKTKRLQFPKYVAITAMDTFLTDVPVNLCPLAEGNPAPNLAAGSDVCHPTTVCEARHKKKGETFLASSFKCRCKAGYRYPFPFRETPWPASLYRRSTYIENQRFFDCIPIQNKMLWPATPGLHPHGEKAGITEVRLTRRRRSVNESQVEVETEEHQIKKMKERIETTRTVLQSFYNVSEIDEVLNDHVDYNSVQKNVRKLVSTFSRKIESTGKSFQPRFDSNWISYATVDSPKKKQKLVSRMKRGTNMPEVTFDTQKFRETRKMFKRFKDIDSRTCHKYSAVDMIMPNTVAYGATTQFHGQAAMALRLAHFLSAFTQLNKEQIVSGIRLGQKLHQHHIVGEALGNVAGDVRVVSSGVFFDRNKFVDPTGKRYEFFGPMVVRKGDLAAASFQMIDMANFDNGYHQKTWFKVLKERWATNPYGLQKFRLEAYMRPSHNSNSQTQIPFYPMIFYAPRYTDGYWTEPYFDCKGPVKKWMITYAAPFFGQRNGQLEFMGVTTASMELARLDVNQCAGNFYQANYFKDTSLCDPVSTFCTPVVGYGFQWGSYRCECRAGYEFPYAGMRYFFLGSLLEDEYEKLQAKKPNIFAVMKCRQASGTFLYPSLLLIYSLVLLTINFLRQ